MFITRDKEWGGSIYGELNTPRQPTEKSHWKQRSHRKVKMENSPVHLLSPCFKENQRVLIFLNISTGEHIISFLKDFCTILLRMDFKTFEFYVDVQFVPLSRTLPCSSHVIELNSHIHYQFVKRTQNTYNTKSMLENCYQKFFLSILKYIG